MRSEGDYEHERRWVLVHVRVMGGFARVGVLGCTDTAGFPVCITSRDSLAAPWDSLAANCPCQANGQV